MKAEAKAEEGDNWKKEETERCRPRGNLGEMISRWRVWYAGAR